MYNITEFIGRRSSTPQRCTITRRLFFVIYHKTGDDAFKFAALTWKKHIRRVEAFIPGHDVFFEREISTERELKKAWGMIYHMATLSRLQVHVGNLLTHASKQSNNHDGLEFRRNPNDQQLDADNDGTLKKDEIRNLIRLPWGPYGHLILCGCNTGLNGQRGWSPAAVFAARQQVPTLGQAGYAYFSKNWENYATKSPTDRRICLWAYTGGRNGPLQIGFGTRMRGKIFVP